MKVISHYIFFLFSITNVVGNLIQNTHMIEYSKPLLMPSLAFLFLANWAGSRSNAFYFTIIALFFSWTGDVLLQLQRHNELFFILGLSAFLIAHLSYIIVYYFSQTDIGLPQSKRFIVIRIVTLAIIGGVLLNVLWPKLDNLTIPVSLYTVIIIMMAVFAVLRKDRTSPPSFSYIYGGALLFIVSDGMIAITKFLQPFEHYRMYIMLTYLLAQFLIVKGILAHQKMVEENS